MASPETGYEDKLFEHKVSEGFHCIICTKVIKDPVACGHNEHLFCRACITEYLKNHQTCPSCMDPLTVDTLSQASRGIRKVLNELRIRCEFFDRGCGKFIELGKLESHVRECGFAPAVCSNEGCGVEVNKQDLLHHETAVCEQRRVKCHSCNDIRREMDIVKINVAEINVKLATIDGTVKRNDEKLDRNEQNMEQNVAAKIELVQEELREQEKSNTRLEADNIEMKKSLNEIIKQLERMTPQTSCEIQDQEKQVKKGNTEIDQVDEETKVVIAGGWGIQACTSSVEMFNPTNGTWTKLRPMREGRDGASSVVYDDQFIVIGGFAKSMQRLPLDAIHVDQSMIWKYVRAELPGMMSGHCSVVYNERLIVIGGFDVEKRTCSDRIIEISLAPPYSIKMLATMPQKRAWSSVAIFDDKIVIVGGRENDNPNSTFRTVVMYDITKGQFTELAPLPYPVSIMSTVKWGDDNVIIIGGVDGDDKPMNTVLIYNVKTRKSHMLPEMKHKRTGCVAVVVKDTVIVMGGRDERLNYLKSVESFRFDRYTWEELPDMHEERWFATGAVC